MKLRRYLVLAGIALVGGCSAAPTEPARGADAGVRYDTGAQGEAPTDSVAAGGVGTLGSGN